MFVNRRISAVGLLGFTLHKYYATISVVADGQPLWNPPDLTRLWPTYFSLVTSAITSVLAAIVLTAYYWSTEAADRIDDWRSRLIWLALALKFGLEIAQSSSMYSTGVNQPNNGPQSLWFQTCTMTPDTIALFSFTINLNQYCSMQVCPLICYANGRNGEVFLLSFRLFWIFYRQWCLCIGLCIGGTGDA
jgi:hypothetical protein